MGVIERENEKIGDVRDEWKRVSEELMVKMMV